MVVDWYSHIERCIKDTQLYYGFHASSAEQLYTHKLLVKTLSNMGYTTQAIVNWYLLAGECKDEYDVEDLLEQSKKMMLPTKHTFRVWITKHEIEYIDHLDVMRDVKCYLLAMVCYCKMMKIRTKKPECKTRAYSYLYYLGTGKDDFSANKSQYMQKEMRKLQKQGVYKPDQNPTTVKKYGSGRGAKKEVIEHNIIKASWIDWEAINGYEVTNLDTQVLDLCNRAFGPDTKYCAKCGSVFLITTKTKRRLCDECYKESHKKPVQYVECPQCCTIFGTTGQTKRKLCLNCYNEQRKKADRERKARKST